MSNVRVFFAEVDGSDDVVRSVVSEMAARINGPAKTTAAAVEIAAPASAPVARQIAAPAAVETSAAGGRRISPAGKARIIAGAKKRWAAVRAAKSAPAPDPAQAPAPQRKVRVQFAPPAPDGGREVTERSDSRSTILALLRKGPVSSGELIERSGLSAPTVYTHLTDMRKRGMVESREEPKSGERKNFLVSEVSA